MEGSLGHSWDGVKESQRSSGIKKGRRWIKYEALAVVVYEYEGRRIISVVYKASVKCIFFISLFSIHRHRGLSLYRKKVNRRHKAFAPPRPWTFLRLLVLRL